MIPATATAMLWRRAGSVNVIVTWRKDRPPHSPQRSIHSGGSVNRLAGGVFMPGNQSLEGSLVRI
jgi:hypothetical protein